MKKVCTFLVVPATLCAAITLFSHARYAKSKAANPVITSTAAPAGKPVAAKKAAASPVAPNALSKIYSDIEQQEYGAGYDSVTHAWQSPNCA